jgi:hypothetical protein
MMTRTDIASFDLRLAENSDADGNTPVELSAVRRLPSPTELLEQSRFLLALGLLTILLSTGRLAAQTCGCRLYILRKVDFLILSLAAMTIVFAAERVLLLLSLR